MTGEATAEILPLEAQLLLKAFLEARKTGQFILHIKEGNPLDAETIEKKHLHLDKLSR